MCAGNITADLGTNYITVKKGFVIIFRIATVDMVLWDGTNSPDSQLCAHEVAIGTTEYATRARSSLRCQISAVAGKGHRSLQ